jgi:glycosyltransferase involved in cell wall biosynthesis
LTLAVITTVFNEAESVEGLIGSLLAQSRPADRIVVADGGSSDGTLGVLSGIAATHPTVRVIEHPGNRSEGRNAAIRAADADLVACIDGGCTADPGWLEAIARPLEAGADWVAGFYRPVGATLRSTCLGLVMVYVREEVDEDLFLPSARSMAFRNRAWAAVGGFPEDTEFAEDTLFDQRMLDAGYRPRFAGDAIVSWTPPSSYRQLAATMFRWGHGDGQAGLRGPVYKRLLLVYGAIGVTVVVAALAAPWAIALPLLALVADAVRRTRFKYRWASGLMKYLHIPLAQVVATTATLVGFVAGRLTRS